jgi:hypothetical protein
MSEPVALLASLVVAKDAHDRATARPFIGVSRAIDEDDISFEERDVLLSDMDTEENSYDVATGRWRLRCMFHEDDWYEANHGTLTRFLEQLAGEGSAGVVFGYGEWSPCLVWHLRDGGVRHDELEAEQFPANVVERLAAEELHDAASAMLAWCDGRSR